MDYVFSKSSINFQRNSSEEVAYYLAVFLGSLFLLKCPSSPQILFFFLANDIKSSNIATFMFPSWDKCPHNDMMVLLPYFTVGMV